MQSPEECPNEHTSLKLPATLGSPEVCAFAAQRCDPQFVLSAVILVNMSKFQAPAGETDLSLNSFTSCKPRVLLWAIRKENGNMGNVVFPPKLVRQAGFLDVVILSCEVSPPTKQIPVLTLKDKLTRFSGCLARMTGLAFLDFIHEPQTEAAHLTVNYVFLLIASTTKLENCIQIACIHVYIYIQR